jgi:aquaporin Z
MVMVYAIGSISGCHINPAITIAMLAARKISLRDSIIYIVVQCIGAIIGAELLLWIALGMPEYTSAAGLGQNGYGALSPLKFTMQAGFIAEVVLTFFFILVIFGATSKEAPKGFSGAAIGFTLFIVHLVGIPVTGTSVNPARSLGPALILGGEAVNQLWMFWLAPIIGGLLAAVVWIYALAPTEVMSREDFERERRDAMESARKVKMKKEAEDKARVMPKRAREEEEEDEEEEAEEGEDEDEEEEEEKKVKKVKGK